MTQPVLRSVGGRRSPPPRRGFTIIELLVSISIMSLLMGIVLPVMSKAREMGRRTACSVRLREVGSAAFFYLQAEKFFPSLNNEPSDGHWQYNYLIWDGRDFNHNFGPLVQRGLVPDIRILFCPTQDTPYHQLNTFVNPWPVQQLLDTRAGYGRRHLVSGMDVTQLPVGTAIYADLFHTSKYIEMGHRNGLNVCYADGHVTYVPAFELLVDNPMALPTSLMDNQVMRDIWMTLDAR